MATPIGQTIWLQTTNNYNCVSTRIDQANAPLQASASQVQVWEEFDVVDAGNGLIALRSHANNNYVSARIDQTNTPLQVSSTQIQQWEQFNWLPQSNGTVALQAVANNNYVSARTDQTNTPLQASSTQVQQWEQFRWGLVSSSVPNPGPTTVIGQTIWLQTTNNNSYVSTRSDQTNVPLQASASQVQAWEQFDVVNAGNGLIALRSHANNNYVSARADQTNTPLQASATQIQQWEQFNWLPQSNGTIALQAVANNNYVSARTDQTNTPLQASVTQIQQWEQFRWGPPGLPVPPSSGGGFAAIVSQQTYEAMFPNRNGLYDYGSLITALEKYPLFCNEGSPDQQRREAAAFLANVSQESGSLYYTDEQNPSSTYCDYSNTTYPCAPGQTYHGRGPLQISWNYNYGAAGQALGLDLLNNPGLVASDGVTSFLTAFWFWMTPQPPKPSCHAVMIDVNSGFGMTINIINGGIECGQGQPTPGAQARVNYYQHFTQMLGVDMGPNLTC